STPVREVQRSRSASGRSSDIAMISRRLRDFSPRSHRSSLWGETALRAMIPMMRATADVVVIGAGIMGLAVAYELSRLTAVKLSVVVVDASYLCGGASGRNGGGVRAQWSDALSVELMKETLAEFRSFARRHRINTWFRAGGYLFLARTDARAKELAHSVEVQRGAGLDTRLLAPNEVNAIVPELSTSGVLVARSEEHTSE